MAITTIIYLMDYVKLKYTRVRMSYSKAGMNGTSHDDEILNDIRRLPSKENE